MDSAKHERWKQYNCLVIVLPLLSVMMYVSHSLYSSSVVMESAIVYKGYNTGSPPFMANATHFQPAPTNITRRLCSNQERKDYVMKMCRMWGSPDEVGGSRLLVDDKYRLMQCSIPKSAGTTWKALWETANKYEHEHPEEQFKTEVNKLSIHGKAVRDAGLKLVELKYKDKYSDYMKFIVVRNPFDRIHSAYVNVVFRRPGTPGPDPIIKKYLEQFNVNHGRSKKIKFQHFLELLLNDTSNSRQIRYKNDRHWQPMSYHCDICSINYDYILRSESLSYDSGPILKKLGYPEDFLLAEKLNLNRYSTKKTHTASDWTGDSQVNVIKPKNLKVYKEIPKLLYDKFVNRFMLDLLLFGYSFDLHTARTECNVHLQSGEVCC